MGSESEAPFVLERQSGHVRWLTLNRPEQRNPLSSGMIRALRDAVSRAGDDSQVRCVVIASSGPVFSAGHDLREMGGQAGESKQQRLLRVKALLADCAEMMLSLMHSPKAMIACVEGTATAAGCQLVSACDLALAGESARFCTPGVNMGMFCTTPLVGVGRNMHRKHALELALTGDLFPAEHAMRIGLVNRVVPDDQVNVAVEAFAQQIASKSAQAIRAGKETFYRQIDMPVEEAFDYASEAMAQAVMSDEVKEGAKAFFEKRAPVWGDA